MVGFSKKKINSYTLGEKLKRIREDMRISLAEIAKATKVKQSYLEKIEEGDFDNLPPDVYVKGFLKSYAGYLGINEKEVIEQYKKECGIKDNMKKGQVRSQSKKRSNFPSITVTPRFFTTVFIVLIILGGFFYFYREIGNFSQDPRLIVMQPSGDLSIDNATLDVIGITDKDSKIFINDQPVFVNEKGEFKENLGLQNGMNNIVIKSVSHFDKEIEKVFNISADYEVQVAEGGTDHQEKIMGVQDIKNDMEKVKVEIKVEEFPVWVSVRIDDKDVQSGTMLPGSIQIFEADEKISITSGRANKTFIKFNEQDVGVLGDDPGVLRDVIFNKNTQI